MTKQLGKRTTGAAIFVVVALVFASAGVAYFIATGSGGGSADSATAQGLTISVASPGSSALYPGGSADLAASVHNPNSNPVHVHSFVLDTSQADDGIAIAAAGCSRGSVTFNGPATNGANDFVFPPGDSSLTLHNALSMSATAENACQSATFTVYLQASS